MTIDLNSMSRKELQKLSRDVEKALATLDKREQKTALDAAERVAQEHGFSLAELTTGATTRRAKGKGKSGSINPPKYRNPADASQTWSGRGRKPDWIKTAEAAGTDIATFAI